jgi:hypothetical protein
MNVFGVTASDTRVHALSKKHRYVFESIRVFSERGKENSNEATITWDLVSTI